MLYKHLAVAALIAIVGVNVTNANADSISDMPVTTENEQVPKVQLMARQTPCANVQLVTQILAERGQMPIAQGTALQAEEPMEKLFIAHNAETNEFSIIIVNTEYNFACNLYAGKEFRITRQ